MNVATVCFILLKQPQGGTLLLTANWLFIREFYAKPLNAKG